MDNLIINERLMQYTFNTVEQEEFALKEILQEVALYALSTTDFFSKALFQGGTALRILYHLPRFSEDLDFLLKAPDKHFKWNKYVDQMAKAFELFNIKPEIVDRSKASEPIQKLFLKDQSIGKIIHLKFHHHSQRKLLIKFEIDTNPPKGSNSEIKYVDFPLDYSILTQDLPSNFSGKCHALLCRPYIKGRDWFDFSWYVSKRVSINFKFLGAALEQSGPWAHQGLAIKKEWLVERLLEKIKGIDWKKVKVEVEKFINDEYQNSLSLWSSEFFKSKIHKLAEYL